MPSTTSQLEISTDHTLEEARQRLEWRNNDKENTGHKQKRESPRKSHGISPSEFHRKKSEKANSWTEDFHANVDQNLFLQSKKEHFQTLEAERKAFKLITSLKRWPVQDMAMEHLDHLLGTNAASPFHGGEYLSAESSSSAASSSTEANKQQRRRQASPRKMKQQVEVEAAVEKFRQNKESLWSREPRIFATEKAQGKRKYLVGHFGRIADWYWRKAEAKHLYEVIRENTPCRLYFDLEFSKTFNQQVNEEALLEEFREEVAADLKEYFQIALEMEMLIDLDSSTDSKFSRHWIFDLDQHGLFQDAPGVGRFVKRLVGRLAEELATGVLAERRPELAKHLFVQTKDPNKTSCFIDLGVYTRNRLFRVFASSKFGKTASLQPADTNQYPIRLPPKQPPTPKSTLEEYVIANDWKPHARALADTLVVPLGGNKSGHILEVPEDESSAGFRRTNKTTTTASSNNVAYHPSLPRIRTATSFLPALDNYVLDVLATRGGIPGTIRALSVEYGPRDDPVSITYQLARNRYCELIGRSHKSNNIYWTVVLGGSWTCVQGCHDPECFGRGSPVAISKDRLPAIEEEWQAWQEEQFENALLALNLQDVEEPANNNSVETSKTKEPASADDEFEKALLALNLDNDVKTKGGPNTANPTYLYAPSGSDKVEGDLNASVLSDTDLLEAALCNPELFP